MTLESTFKNKLDTIALLEANFDGLVGPSHNFSGLAIGNIASKQHADQIAHPKQAALQGLKKMAYMMELGLTQGVLPPPLRPDILSLRRLGFRQPITRLLSHIAQEQALLLNQVSSASAMWVANAATISPSVDSLDGKVHITPANLHAMAHRSIEADFTGKTLKRIFADEAHFTHHQSLPPGLVGGDEGAANHTRCFNASGQAGVQIFVYGHTQQTTLGDGLAHSPNKYPARQSLAASQAIARLHQVHNERCLFWQQNPAVIDQGVFHHDVIGVGSANVKFLHAEAIVDQANQLARLRARFETICEEHLHIIEVPAHRISVADAVASYLFNSQLVQMPTGELHFIAPIECQEQTVVRQYLAELVAQSNPITQTHFLDLRQSMYNGGGPACLRLRVQLTQTELAAIQPRVLLTPQLYVELVAWVNQHYRDELRVRDLADPELYRENCLALTELASLMRLGDDFYEIESA